MHVVLWPPDGCCHPVPKAACEALADLVSRRRNTRERTLVLVGETQIYRTAARHLAGPSDRAVELGSAFGDCLAALHKRTGGTARGVDISPKAIAEAEKRFPQLVGSMEVMDCVREDERLAAFVAGADLVFLDVGGDRHGETICRLVASALASAACIVVKNRTLHTAAAAAGDVSVSEWWREVTERSVASDGLGGAGLRAPRWARRAAAPLPNEQAPERAMGTPP